MLPRALNLVKKTTVKADINKAGQINVSRSWKSLRALHAQGSPRTWIEIVDLSWQKSNVGMSRASQGLFLTVDSRNNCSVHTLLLYARKFFLFTLKKKVSKFSTLSGYIIKYHPPNRRQYKTPVDVKQVGEGGGDGRKGGEEGVSYPQPCRGSWCFFFQDVISEK